jgi:DNA-binding NarL/FixJ family response regulator
MATRTLLVEDHALVRAGLRALLDGAEGLEVIGEAPDGRHAVSMCESLQPELVLMDVAMPDLNGIEAARQIRTACPAAKILMVSMHESRQYIFESLKAGANGYVLKEAAFTELLAAIKEVLEGRTYLSPKLSETVMDDYVRRAQGGDADSELQKLSAREREVLQLIAEGNSSAEISKVLGISARTVDTHRHNIMEKLHIHSIAGLTRFAIRHGVCSVQ